MAYTEHLLHILADKTGKSPQILTAILELLDEGKTIPFIARYRKEITGNATDEELRSIGEAYEYQTKLAERKEEVIRLITERGKMTPEIAQALTNATTLSGVEDIYRPFKEKKNTRAGLAIAKGLQPLADILMQMNLSIEAFENEGQKFIKNTGEDKTSVLTLEEAINGAKDIVAEMVADRPDIRQHIATRFLSFGTIMVKKTKEFDAKGPYTKYEEHTEHFQRMPSHRYLAVCRGEKEKQLSVNLDLDPDKIAPYIERTLTPANAQSSKNIALEAAIDGLKRLLLPSLERELRSEKLEQAERRAIMMFGKNVQELLVTRPVRGKVVLGLDPGFRTGCKYAVLNAEGTVLATGVIYPTEPKKDIIGTEKTLETLIQKHHITAIALGNGTASRETQEVIARFLEKNKKTFPNVAYTIISEAGASVYSASELAQKEYPQHDVTIRGAISLAFRLIDPMAALVKIDPKSLGVGQYQHDVNQKLLAEKLHDAVESIVNQVGVDANTASAELLSYIAGMSRKTAEAFVEHREQNGRFISRKDFLKVAGIGPKAFEQCAGFLRIREGKEPLDNTSIHPESYDLARTIQKGENISPEIMIQKAATIEDIKTNLQKPGLDPRDDLPEVPFRTGILSLSDLRVGSIVSGVVRSITDFGAFIDIGIKNDALLHVSQMSTERTRDPFQIVSINQVLPNLSVVQIDEERGKVGVSLIA